MKNLLILAIIILFIGCGNSKNSEEQIKKEIAQAIEIESEKLNKEIQKQTANIGSDIILKLKLYFVDFSESEEGYLCTITHNGASLKLTEKNSLDVYLNHLNYKDSDNIYISLFSTGMAKNFDQYEERCKYFLSEYYNYVNMPNKKSFTSGNHESEMLSYKDIKKSHRITKTPQ